MKETGRKGYQSIIKKRIKDEFPECMVYRLDPNEIQGSPDLIIICPTTWATLETKANKNSSKQPNQDHYVNKHNDMSFSRIVYPENEIEVFEDLFKHIKNFNRKGRI